MKLDGRALADELLASLSGEVSRLSTQGIVPTLAVILVGDDAGSLSYIRQKRKAAESIGARLLLEQLSADASPEAISSTIAHYNNDSSVHGLIVQRPIGHGRHDADDILATVSPQKDVDGFVPHSPFQVPVAKAVLTILERIHTDLTRTGLVNHGFSSWISGQTIAVIGRGETAGKPIAHLLESLTTTLFVVHSATREPESVLQEANIIVSCVGKPGIVKADMIERGVILISVGIHRGKEGNLAGDYDDHDVAQVASFYTPTPGGVGPVNVACLMQNLINACILQTGGTL